jgi:hypothetical protein
LKIDGNKRAWQIWHRAVKNPRSKIQSNMNSHQNEPLTKLGRNKQFRNPFFNFKPDLLFMIRTSSKKPPSKKKLAVTASAVGVHQVK